MEDEKEFEWDPVIKLDYLKLIEKYLITGAEEDDAGSSMLVVSCVIAEYGTITFNEREVVVTFPSGKIMRRSRLTRYDHAIVYALHMKMGKKYRVRCFPSLLRYAFSGAQGWVV